MLLKVSRQPTGTISGTEMLLKVSRQPTGTFQVPKSFP